MRNTTAILALSGLTATGLQAADKPNIVFILADDLGYAEVGCYGQKKIKTPNIDKLAKEGMRFTQHYTGAPVCAPARCTLMTGKNLSHAEIRGNRDSGNGHKFPGQWPITAEAITIAEVLHDNGYTTGAFGKWGLGPTESTGAPNKQGFDRYYGYICQRNAHSYYPPYLDSDDKEETINEHPIPGHMKQLKGEVKAETYRAENYAPDLILAEALKFIDTNKDKPFFLYLPFVEPHVAMQPPQKWIDMYPKSWDTVPYRGTRGYLPHPRPHAAYAAMISQLDNHVGVVLAQLKKYGLDKNTIVIFTSDNGATHNVGGVETEFFDSMGGLRGKKGSCYEGGLRMPCIVRWPGKVKAGSENDVPSYFPDWFPTLCEIGGAPLPKEPLDGVSLTNVLGGGNLPKRHEPMLWEFFGYGGIVAIREGKWKAVRTGLRRKNHGKWELYNLAEDREEKNDVADKHPEMVQKMEKAWLKTRTVSKIFPIPMVD
jgi:arylsulfatase A-like enzyme